MGLVGGKEFARRSRRGLGESAEALSPVRRRWSLAGGLGAGQAWERCRGVPVSKRTSLSCKAWGLQASQGLTKAPGPRLQTGNPRGPRSPGNARWPWVTSDTPH